MSKYLVVTEAEATMALHDFVSECDIDDLAHLYGQVFGYDAEPCDGPDGEFLIKIRKDGQWAGHMREEWEDE